MFLLLWHASIPPNSCRWRLRIASGSWGALLISVQERTRRVQLDWVPSLNLHPREPDFALMTPSNRAAFFRLSLLVAERLLNKHLLCQVLRISG